MTFSAAKTNRSPVKGFTALSITIVLWGLNPVLIKYFTDYFDVWTMNAFRYSIASLLVMSALLLTRGWRKTFALDRQQWRSLMLVSISNIFMQTAFAGIYYFLYPSVAALLGRISILVLVFMSFLVFPDERNLILRSRFFQSGLVLTLVGVVGILFWQDPEVLARLEIGKRTFWIGVAIICVHVTFIATYTLSIRYAMRRIDPILAYGHVSWMSSILFLLLMFALGAPTDLMHAPPSALGLMTLTAIFSLAVAHTCYYVALQNLKVIVTVSVMQLSPVLTIIISALVYGDILSPKQILFGLLVMLGAWMVGVAEPLMNRKEIQVRGRGA